MEFLCIKCELNLNKRMEDDYGYAPESVLARVISSEVSKKCCNWFRNDRTIFPTNQKRGTCHVHQVGLFECARQRNCFVLSCDHVVQCF